MPKHLIAEDFMQKNGFKIIKVGGNYISANNVDDQILELMGDGTVDIAIKDNKLVITSKRPVFSKVEW